MSCINPFLIKKQNGEIVSVPCRHCIGCTIKKIQELKVYATAEMTDCSLRGHSSSFVRLSYNDANLPIMYNGELKRLGEIINNGKVPNNFQPTLLKSDFVKFMKRVRINIKRDFDGRKIKYLYCGEYGDLGNRPHYHIVMFGLSPVQCKLLFSKQWKFGFCDYKPLKAGAVSYISKYMFHDVFGKEKYEKYNKIGIEAPFLYHSCNLGSNYLAENRNNGFVPINGKKLAYPNYYAKKFDIDKKAYTVEQLKQFAIESIKRSETYVINQRQRAIAVDSSSINNRQLTIDEKRNQTPILERLHYEK